MRRFCKKPQRVGGWRVCAGRGEGFIHTALRNSCCGRGRALQYRSTLGMLHLYGTCMPELQEEEEACAQRKSKCLEVLALCLGIARCILVGESLPSSTAVQVPVLEARGGPSGDPNT